MRHSVQFQAHIGGILTDLVIPAHAQLTPLCGGLFADLSHLLLLLTVH